MYCSNVFIFPEESSTVLPRLEIRWSRVELSATCYRVCENAGTLAIQVTRSGNSIDPAYVTIQVELP